MNRWKFTVACAAACSVLAGCGGSASSSGEPAAREASFGPISTRAVGPIAEPVVFSGGAATVTGIYGANFLNVTVNALPDTPDYNKTWDMRTPIAMNLNGRAGYLDPQTYAKVSINTTPATSNVLGHATFNNPGQNLISSESDSAGYYQIYSTSTDGKSRVALTTGNTFKYSPSVSKTTGQICYSLDGNIWVMDANGANPTQLTTTAETELRPKFSPDGTKIGYLKFTGSLYQFWEMNANGTGQAQMLNSVGVDSFDYHPTERVVVLTSNAGTTRYLFTAAIPNSGSRTLDSATSPSTFNDATFSPTGAQVAAKRSDGTTSWLSVYDSTTYARQDLVTISVNDVLGDWGPLPRKKFFINATSGFFHTNAAGFMFGTVGESMVSMLAFDAQTRTTVDIDAHNTSSAAANYTATITAADKLTMLRYANGLIAPRVTIIDPAVLSTHAQGALVSIVSATGRIGSVLTFTRSRGSNKPATTKKGDIIEFDGEFLAAYDGEGKLIKSKPTDVKVNAKTGTVSYK